MTAVRVPRAGVEGGFAPLDSGLLVPAAYLPAGTTAAQGALQLDGAAADLALSSASPAAGSTGKAADAGHAHPRRDWQPADHGMLGWTYDPASYTSTTALSSNGSLYIGRIHVPVAVSVTNVLAYVETPGSGLTAGQCFAGLWVAAEGGALIAATADQSASWAADSGLATMALAGGPYALAAGQDVYVGLWANGSTGPTLRRSATTYLASAGTEPVYRFARADTGLTTTPPATLGSMIPSGNTWWLGLS